jgi:hypothetical protein
MISFKDQILDLQIKRLFQKIYRFIHHQLKIFQTKVLVTILNALELNRM